MSKLEQSQTRLQARLRDELEKIDKEFLRRVQIFTYDCSLRCVKNEKFSSADVQQCLNRCQEPSERAQDIIENHVNQLKSGLQRCVANCSFRIRKEFPDDVSDAELKKFRSQTEACTIQCMDTHLRVELPNVFSQLRAKSKEFKIPTLS